MYCTNCGQALDGLASVCPSCGALVEETGAASTSNFSSSPVLNASNSQLETTGEFKPYFIPNLIAAFLGCGSVYFLTGVYFATVAKSKRAAGSFDEARLKAKVAKVLFWQGVVFLPLGIVMSAALIALFNIVAP